MLLLHSNLMKNSLTGGVSIRFHDSTQVAYFLGPPCSCNTRVDVDDTLLEVCINMTGCYSSLQLQFGPNSPEKCPQFKAPV